MTLILQEARACLCGEKSRASLARSTGSLSWWSWWSLLSVVTDRCWSITRPRRSRPKHVMTIAPGRFYPCALRVVAGWPLYGHRPADPSERLQPWSRLSIEGRA